MKRLVFLLSITVFLSVALAFVPRATAAADSASRAEEELEEYVDRNLDALDVAEFETFCRGLAGGDVSVRETMAALIKGELSLTPRELLSLVWSAFTSSFTRVLPSLAIIVLISLLFNLLMGLTQNFLRRQTTDVVYFVCYGAVLLTVVTIVVNVVTSVRKTVTSLVSVMNLVTPPLTTLMTALGASSTSALFRPQLAFCCTLVGDVIANIVLPLFIASVVFSVVGNLSDSVRLDKLQSATRYIVGVVLGVVFGLFTTYLTVAGIAGSMADTMSVRAARYVIGSYLPLLGGYISQGFDLVTASLNLIKNALGVYAVLTVLTVVLGPLLELTALVVGLKLTAGLIEPIGDRRMASFVSSVGECMRSLLAAVAGVGFTFIVTLLLVMCSVTMVL
ncbi:MAG: stage III sporulation protein AE [Clostridia bacterium]|nr:stage III sporulation protein AE [Clostridia bacterium]